MRSLRLLLILFFIPFCKSSAQEVHPAIVKTIGEIREFVAIPNDATNMDDMKDNVIWLKKAFAKREFEKSLKYLKNYIERNKKVQKSLNTSKNNQSKENIQMERHEAKIKNAPKEDPYEKTVVGEFKARMKKG